MSVTTANKADTATLLQNLALLRQRQEYDEVDLRTRIRLLRRDGVGLKEIGQAAGLSESQVSRITSQPENALPAATAMELVKKAECGEIDHDSFLEWLKVWPYEPQDKPANLADDSVFRDNSWDAVGRAYDKRLLSDDELLQLYQAAASRGLTVV